MIGMMYRDVKEMFPDWRNLDKGSWSKNTEIIEYGINNNGDFLDKIEIGLYREPDGKYTLQIFNGDAVVVCENCSELEVNEFEKARAIGTIWDKYRHYFDKMIEGVTYYGRELTDPLLCHVYDFIDWSKYDANTLGYEQVEDALQMFIFNLKYERILLQDMNYDEVHKGFVAGLYRATDEEIRQADIMWADEESDDCIGYYEEAFDRIRGNY
jgi:hypothetical protein